jgi:predicted PolB exonuclease-like 3'-5' exonuclease
MLFRVTDIETVPDLSVWTPGEPRWALKPGMSPEIGPGFRNPCSTAHFFDYPTNCGSLRNVTYVKEEPFPPPQAHRVVAIAWCDVDMQLGSTTPVKDKTYKLVGGRTSCDWATPEAERTMLERFGREQEAATATLVTWNGRTFDLPVLSMRALHHGVPWRWYYHERNVRYRYSDEGHCDLMDFLSDYGASRQMKLGDAARLIGLPGKTDMDGSKVADVVAEGLVPENMLRVGRYCLQDAIQTAILFVRTRYHLGIITREGYDASVKSFEDSLLTKESDIVIDWDRLKIGGQS